MAGVRMKQDNVLQSISADGDTNRPSILASIAIPFSSGVLVISDCRTRCHRLGGMNNRHLFLTVLEA